MHTKFPISIVIHYNVWLLWFNIYSSIKLVLTKKICLPIEECLIYFISSKFRACIILFLSRTTNCNNKNIIRIGAMYTITKENLLSLFYSWRKKFTACLTSALVRSPLSVLLAARFTFSLIFPTVTCSSGVLSRSLSLSDVQLGQLPHINH